MPTRLGLVGANNQGREHLAAAKLTEHVDIVAVCDLVPSVLESALADFGPFATYSSITSMLQAQVLDGLIVALPHHVYANVWDEITSSSLPILKEKPLARTMAEALDFMQTARRRGCPVATAIQRRYHESYRFLKSWIAGKQVRSVLAIYHLGIEPSKAVGTWRDQPQLSGGGALLDCGYHMVDLMQFLLGPLSMVACNLWVDGLPAPSGSIESDVSLVARTQATWVRMEISRGGDRDESGKLVKQEQVVLEANKQTCLADRTGVFIDGEQVFDCGRSWELAMKNQLETFADQIQSGKFDEPNVWEQLPAMQLIQQAYATAEAAGMTWKSS